MNASSSTSKAKGFDVDGLEYIDDLVLEDKKIYGSSFYYGKVSMWAAVYELVVDETDGTQSGYYFIFIESSIESRGKAKIGLINNYFRNKYLTIDVKFKSSKIANLVDYTMSDNGAMSSYTKAFGVDISGNVSTDSAGIGVQGSYTMQTTQEYDAVCLTPSKGDIEGGKYFQFEYYFSNWKNGKMIAPNKGLVTERVAVVYQIENYQNTEEYSVSISTKATIFKDVTGGVNSTESGTITFAGPQGKLAIV